MQAEATECFEWPLFRSYLCARFGFEPQLCSGRMQGSPITLFKQNEPPKVIYLPVVTDDEDSLDAMVPPHQHFYLMLIERLGNNERRLKLDYQTVTECVADFCGIHRSQISGINFNLPDAQVSVTKREQVVDLLAKPEPVEYRQNTVNVKLGIIVSLGLTLIILAGAFL